MTWAVGVLTWNRHERCRETLRLLRERIVGKHLLVVYDNGSDEPFHDESCCVVRGATNVGAGGGMTECVRNLLATGADHLLFLEDDWTLEGPLDLWNIEPVLSIPVVGQVRLAVRHSHAPRRYWTYGLEGDEAAQSLAQRNADILDYGAAGHGYQLVKLLWSNNPWACRRDVAERFCLSGKHENAMARPYFDSTLMTAATIPGYFRHGGEVKERRGDPGWKR